jgi:transposase-like protein
MKNTNCPKCDSQLLFTNEVEVSKRIRCPKCKNEFDNPNYKNSKTYQNKEFNIKNIKPINAVVIGIITLFIIGYFSNGDNLTTVYITQSGYMGASSEEVLDRFTEYSIHKDYEAIQQLMNNGMIVSIPSGKEAFVVKANFSTVKIRIKGETSELWTVIEAIKEH